MQCRKCPSRLISVSSHAGEQGWHSACEKPGGLSRKYARFQPAGVSSQIASRASPVSMWFGSRIVSQPLTKWAYIYRAHTAEIILILGTPNKCSLSYYIGSV